MWYRNWEIYAVLMILKWLELSDQNLWEQFTVKIREKMVFIAQIYHRMEFYRLSIFSTFCKKNDDFYTYFYPIYRNSLILKNLNFLNDMIISFAGFSTDF